MKKVSIIIPTRNRAHLLKYALKSAQEQTYQNLEIIVCDNCSEDNTNEIVNSINNKKIIYIKTNKVLTMPDNWEFALSKAHGEYIIYLTDDSYLLANSIDIAMREMNKFQIGVAVWKHCAYFSSDWLEPARKNILYIPKVTYKSYLLNSKTNLQKLYNNDEKVSIIIPKSLNSCCHRSIIDKVITLQKRFFLPPCPDYTSAASVLLNTKKYLLIDQFLYIDGVTTASIGAMSNFNIGKSVQDFIKEFDNKLEDIYFLGIRSSISSIAKSLEIVKKFYLNICPEINKKTLMCAIVDRLMKLESNNVNTSNDWQIINKYLTQQSINIKLSIFKQKLYSQLKWLMIKKIRSSANFEYLETLRNMQIVRGENKGFNNIEEAAKFLTIKKRSIVGGDAKA